MPRRFLAVLVCSLVVAPIAFAGGSPAPAPFRIDDTGVALVFRNGQTFARLTPAAGAAGRDIQTRAHVEILSPSGVTVASVGRDVTFANGSRSADVALPFDLTNMASTTRQLLPWHRLRYSLTPGGTGTVSFSEI